MSMIRCSTTPHPSPPNSYQMLLEGAKVNGLVHESVQVDDPSKFTRADFGWVGLLDGTGGGAYGVDRVPPLANMTRPPKAT